MVWNESRSPAVFLPLTAVTAKTSRWNHLFHCHPPQTNKCVVRGLRTSQQQKSASMFRPYTECTARKVGKWNTVKIPVEVESTARVHQPILRTCRRCFKYMEQQRNKKSNRWHIKKGTYTMWLAWKNKMFGSWELVGDQKCRQPLSQWRRVLGAIALNRILRRPLQVGISCTG